MDLRGLGPTRTLVLLDGRRVVPSSDNGTVDMSGIPSSLVKRAEVVTGGASAAYGADAVAGVVNVILDTKFTGFKTDINAGVAEAHGDDQTYFVSGAADRTSRADAAIGYLASKLRKNEASASASSATSVTSTQTSPATRNITAA